MLFIALFIAKIMDDVLMNPKPHYRLGSQHSRRWYLVIPRSVGDSAFFRMQCQPHFFELYLP